MPAPAKHDWPVWPLKLAAFALFAAAAMLLALRFDQPVFALVHNRQGVESWLYFAVRRLGDVPTWLIIAPLVMIFDWLVTRRRALLGAFERGLLLIWAPMLAGIASSLLKFMIRRERPDAHAGEYFFRPWNESSWDSSGLGLPSGHAAVAFGGACMLAFLYPRFAPLWILAAVLCAASRLMTHAHFLSDIVGGAILGFAAAWLFSEIYRRWCENRDPVLVRAYRQLQRKGAPAPAK